MGCPAWTLAGTSHNKVVYVSDQTLMLPAFFKHSVIGIWRNVETSFFNDATCFTLNCNVYCLYFNDIQPSATVQSVSSKGLK